MTERKISAHALEQAARRGVEEETVSQIAERPSRWWKCVRGARCGSRASRVRRKGKSYLVRVFVDIAAGQETVVTVYKTGKVAKYWRVS